MSEQDTREKLEADIRAWHRDTPFATKPSVQTLLGWLDRQAAITRNIERGMHDFILDNLQQECDKLTDECDKLTAAVEKWADAANAQRLVAMEQADKVCELTAERDQLSRDLTAEHALVSQFEYDNEQLREAIDAMENAQFYAMYKAKCDECEQLKKVVRTQADSFKKLEIELAGKQ